MPKTFETSLEELQRSPEWHAVEDAREQHGSDIHQMASDSATRTDMLEELVAAMESTDRLYNALDSLWKKAHATLK